MGNLGAPELIVVLIVLAVIFLGRRQFSKRHSAVGAVEYPYLVSSYRNRGATTMDASTADKMADLFGLEENGLRWRQVWVLTAGTWMAWSGFGIAGWGGILPLHSIELSAPVFFVMSAVVALRRWNSIVAITGLGGTLYALLTVAFAWIIGPRTLAFGLEPWIRFAAWSFVTWSSSMLAIAYAVLGRHLWRRMFGGFFVASLAATYLAYLAVTYLRAIYGSEVDALLLTSADLWGPLFVSSGLWTAAFYAADRVGRRPDTRIRQVDDFWATRLKLELEPTRAGALGVERFLPVAIMAAVTAIALVTWDMGLETLAYMSAPIKITGLFLPIVAATVVASGATSTLQQGIVIASSLASFTAPFLAFRQIMEGIAATGSAGLGTIYAGVAVGLTLLPFVLAAGLALAIVALSRNPTSTYRGNILTLVAASTCIIVLDLLTIRDFSVLAATGAQTSEGAMWTTRWLLNVLKP